MAFMSFPAVQELLGRELGADAERCFTWIDPQPFTSDADTQTHRAHFHTGQDVAITIPRAEGGRDLVASGCATDALRATYLASSAVHIPLVYWKYTTPDVLVREHQEGAPLTAQALREQGQDSRVFARALFLLFAEAFAGDGWCYRYAPEHLLTALPGSRIFVHASDQVGRIPYEIRPVLAALMRAYVHGDLDGVLRGAAEFAGVQLGGERHAQESIVASWVCENSDVPFGQLFSTIVDVLPPNEDLRTLSDVLVNLEQAIIMLYPAFDFTSAYDAVSRHIIARPLRVEHFPRYAAVS